MKRTLLGYLTLPFAIALLAGTAAPAQASAPKPWPWPECEPGGNGWICLLYAPGIYDDANEYCDDWGSQQNPWLDQDDLEDSYKDGDYYVCYMLA